MSSGIKKEGSNLSGVYAKCWWEENFINNSPGHHTGFPPGSSHDGMIVRDVAARFPVLPPINSGSALERRSACSSVLSEISRTRTLRGVHLRFGLEAAMLLPLAMR